MKKVTKLHKTTRMYAHESCKKNVTL